MQEAIKHAIEKGYENAIADECLIEYSINGFCSKSDLSPVLLDPLFWQALGKAEGWDTWQGIAGASGSPDWLSNWHRFIDHIASGGDIDDFFNELLKN